ncbi:centrosomal protein 20 isoform X2 [Paroedura picta]|uniref:centrosomal protein 20 isoform X2 n=1 Tax=Paroedura picta TaxID=143630 RepID=UPI004056564F
MATITELKTVLKDTLEKRGILGQIKARIRAEVFNALDDQNELRPPLSHENLLINELIREYLEFNKYKYAASVLVAGRFCTGSLPSCCRPIKKERCPRISPGRRRPCRFHGGATTRQLSRGAKRPRFRRQLTPALKSHRLYRACRDEATNGAPGLPPQLPEPARLECGRGLAVPVKKGGADCTERTYFSSTPS